MARGFSRVTWGFGFSVVPVALPDRPEPLAAMTACTPAFCARIVPHKRVNPYDLRWALVGVAFGVLGPFEVVVDGNDVTPTAPKERALLALLVASPGRVVAADRFVEEQLDVDRARRVLHVRVAALRKRLTGAGAGGLLVSIAPGYRLAVTPEEVDASRFAALVDSARAQRNAGDPAVAATLLREALALWRGEPLVDVERCPSLEAESAQLRDARLGAIEDRVDADLECGRHHAVVSELGAFVALHPLRERLWGQWILALYRCGRQVDALRACESLRRQLVEDIGVEPGPELRALHRAVLEQRPELDWSSADGVASTARSRPPTARPRVRYVRTHDGVHIAYQVVGTGPLDLIVVPGFVSHLDSWWEGRAERLTRRLASRSRLILFDKRGMGLSDRPPNVDVEHWIEDTRAVLDAARSERAVVVGVSAGGPTALLFAATHPERTRALVMYGAFARLLRADDYPHGVAAEDMAIHIRMIEDRWGTGIAHKLYTPSAADDPLAREEFARFQRASASPGAAAAYQRALAEIDVRHALPMVRAPTLVVHAAGDRAVPLTHARYLAERIPQARLVELPTADHLIWQSEAIDRIADAIDVFLSDLPLAPRTDSVLATVLHANIGPGDQEVARHLAERFRGRPVKHAGDGFVATFDGPARAIRCACQLAKGLETGGAIGVALHSGECELAGEEVRGVAVRIAASVASRAQGGEVLVTHTVKDVVAGSEIGFADCGSCAFDGVPGEWRLYAVTQS